MLHLGAARDWDPPVISTTATEREGVIELWSALDEHRAHLVAGGGLDRRRRDRLVREVEILAAERFRALAAIAFAADESLAEDLVARRTDPYRAAAILAERASPIS
jgi:LAO/AO transport system kinase